MWFDNPVWKELERINNLHRQIMQSPVSELMEQFNRREAMIQSMAGTLMNPAWQSALSQADKISQIASSAEVFRNIGIINGAAIAIKPSVVNMLRDYTELFPKVGITEKILAFANALKSYTSMAEKIMIKPVADVLKTLTKIDFDMLNSCDIGIDNMDLCQDGLLINNEVYTIEEIQDNIVETAKEMSAGIDTKTLSESIKKKFLAFIAFLNIILTLYGTVEMCKDINEHIIAPVVQSIQSVADIEYVKVERAYIKSEPNSKAQNICEVLYAEPVEIVEEIKFWRKVKYHIDGQEVIGWISKISIGTEDDIDK